MSNPDQDRGAWFNLVRQQSGESDKDWTTTFLLSLFLGWLGADRFYLNSQWPCIFKLCTCGGFGIWWLLDVILLLSGAMKDGEGRLVKK